jgi:hypothetical protein
MGSSCRIEPLVALKSILLIATSLLQQGTADYVETAPRPGFPPPRAVIPGECPLVFLQRDIQHAQQSCASSKCQPFCLVGNIDMLFDELVDNCRALWQDAIISK